MIVYKIFIRKGVVTFVRKPPRVTGCVVVYLMPPIMFYVDIDIGADEMLFVRGLIRAIIANEGLLQDETGFQK